MTRQEAFVTRLRRHRQRSRVSLEEIASATRIRHDLLEALERADLRDWPRGLYARAWVRAYAEAVGLDPIESVNEFCRLFPHGDRRADVTMVELAWILDVQPRVHDDQAVEAQPYRRRASDHLRPPASASWPDRLARAAQIVSNVRHLRDLPIRLAESWRAIRPSRRAW
jgi:hypothetical protein